MSDKSALVPRADLFRLADAFVKSGYFRDVRQAAQAVVKIQFGAELGIGPVTAMRGLYVNDKTGKIELTAGLIGALLKRAGWDWQIVKLDDTGCTLRFMRPGGTPVEPPVSFTAEDAHRAGLLSRATYQAYPQDMYFSRALSRGARRYAPEVFGGEVYVVGETAETAPPDLRAHVPQIASTTEAGVGSGAGDGTSPTSGPISNTSAPPSSPPFSRSGEPLAPSAHQGGEWASPNAGENGEAGADFPDIDFWGHDIPDEPDQPSPAGGGDGDGKAKVVKGFGDEFVRQIKELNHALAGALGDPIDGDALLELLYKLGYRRIGPGDMKEVRSALMRWAVEGGGRLEGRSEKTAASE